MSKENILKEIEEKMEDIEKRIAAGQTIISECKRQMRVLKEKLKEFNRLKNNVSSSAADGNL